MEEKRYTQLEELSLTNFRNFVQLAVSFPPGLVLLVGDNAQGKSNLLEAIYYLATTRSPRTTNEEELVNWEAQRANPPFARLEGKVQRGGERHRVEIAIAREVGAGSYRKRIKLDGRAMRGLDFLGRFNVVLFLPEDLALAGGAPVLRRRYLDATLCQLDGTYCRALGQYNRILAHRNRLLRRLRERGGDVSQLDFWDEKLSREGAVIVLARGQLFLELNDILRELHPQLAGPGVELRLAYDCALLDGRKAEDAPLEGRFRERLREERQRELEMGATALGPHRDDFSFREGGIDLRRYGSRAQERRAVVSLKLAEMGLMCRRTGHRPILLLDDVMSELDPQNKRYLSEALRQPGQAIITATDLATFSPSFSENALVLSLERGRIERG